MSPNIHPSAIIEQGAQIADDVTIGAYAYIGSLAIINSGTKIDHHATVVGNTTIGNNNSIHPYAYIGAPTHDLKYKGGEPGLKIGNNNVFREFCTIHVATKPENTTIIGNSNVFLAYSHVAHDCIVGNHVIMSSQAALGGHVTIDDFTNIGWSAGIHQFCRIGKYAMVGASSKATQDIPPYMLSDGYPAIVRSPNFVNLKRNNFSETEISGVKTLYKVFYLRGLNKSQALQAIMSETIDSTILQEFTEFIENSKRGCRF